MSAPIIGGWNALRLPVFPSLGPHARFPALDLISGPWRTRYVSVLRKCLSNWRMGCCVEATVRENIFKAGYLQRKRYSDRRILVTRCVIDGNAHLPACIIEAWAATARETDPEESTHLYAHLEADSAYGLQWWRTR